MKLNKFIIAGSVLAASMSLGSCVGDLNVEPINPDQMTELSSKDEYLGLLMRAYGGLVMEGGISVDDGGAGVYFRQLFNQQELTTDECVIAGNWDDAGVQELVFAQPSADNHWIYEMSSRINYQIALCNTVIYAIENDTKIGDFFTEAELDEMKAEMKVLRSLAYYHMIDIFGHGPYTDENSAVGEVPPTLTRTELFNNTVNVLKESIPHLNPAAQQEYGRVSQEAGYALLAKLYLNAEVYTGTPMWQECADACQKITATIPNLAKEYKYLFCMTNKKYVASSTFGTDQGEILWAVPQDQTTMQCWGNTTYLSTGAYSASETVNVAIYGLQGGPWEGPHMRPETVDRFEANDSRRLFYEGDFTKDLYQIDDWGEPGSCGYMCIKWVLTPEDHYVLDPNAGDPNNPDHQYMALDQFSSIDMPVFRLADIYLMLAECQLNGASCNGLDYYNKVRLRAGLNAVGSYNAQDLLDERNRELYWECHRRSDLIRFGKYTGSTYNWQWKAGVQQGGALESHRNLMPIPTQFVPTLGQNPGY